MLKWKRCPWWIAPALITLLSLFLLKNVFMLAYVPSESMEPTLPKGSYIFASRIFDDLKAGDIVIFRQGEQLMVKRIAAVPGDVIVWSELRYIEGVLPPNRPLEQETVPADSFFMLGDNAQVSFDSRYWMEPFISVEDIVAKISLLEEKIEKREGFIPQRYVLS